MRIKGFIDKDELMISAKAYGKSPYGEHLKAVAEGKVRYCSALFFGGVMLDCDGKGENNDGPKTEIP